MYFTALHETGQMKDIRRVTHALKVVDSYSRVNGVLCAVTWSWLSFLHDESEGKNFELNIA